ncbi:unnamed protein product, partial [Ectocarpus sp. 13 AM-2016]
QTRRTDTITRRAKPAHGNRTRYPECRGAVFRPSFADDGSFDDLPATSPLLSEPPHRLRLERARGYHGGGFYPSTDNNAFFLGENHMPTGDKEGGDVEMMQRFFDGHTDDVTAVAVHPGGVLVASGQ